MLQDLLAAANQYALDWLKLMCTRKLWDNVSVDTVVIILVCAETYGCQELKKKCLDFCVVEKIFKEVASTNGYVLLMLKFALLLLRRKGRDIRRQVIDRASRKRLSLSRSWEVVALEDGEELAS